MRTSETMRWVEMPLRLSAYVPCTVAGMRRALVAMVRRDSGTQPLAVVCICYGDDVNLHLGVSRGETLVGLRWGWYDGPTVEIGAGPLATLCMTGEPADAFFGAMHRLHLCPDDPFTYPARK